VGQNDEWWKRKQKSKRGIGRNATNWASEEGERLVPREKAAIQRAVIEWPGQTETGGESESQAGRGRASRDEEKNTEKW